MALISLRLENNDGLAARTATALLTISDAPVWVTGSGSLGTVANGGTFNFTLTATDAVSFASHIRNITRWSNLEHRSWLCYNYRY